MNNSDVIIVGAGPAGLACAASMGALGLNATVLEKENTVGSVWRRHYDRLHLHTDRGHSGLPGMAMPRAYPTYPSRKQVVEYLEGYAAHFRLQPVFNTTVLKIARNGSQWIADMNKGAVSAPVVVIATGWADFPYRPLWPGSNGFQGNLIHSRRHRYKLEGGKPPTRKAGLPPASWLPWPNRRWWSEAGAASNVTWKKPACRRERPSMRSTSMPCR